MNSPYVGPSFLPGPPIDRTTWEGWRRWCATRDAFVPAPVLTAADYALKSKRQKRLYNLHRLATHSSLPIDVTPMSERVADAVLARVEDGAFSHKACTRGGIMVNGDGAQGKTETVCEALAVFEETWMALNNYVNPDAMPGTRDLVAPVGYVRCPVKATPISTCASSTSTARTTRACVWRIWFAPSRPPSSSTPPERSSSTTSPASNSTGKPTRTSSI